jgi:hypothetical protein
VPQETLYDLYHGGAYQAHSAYDKRILVNGAASPVFGEANANGREPDDVENY